MLLYRTFIYAAVIALIATALGFWLDRTGALATTLLSRLLDWRLQKAPWNRTGLQNTGVTVWWYAPHFSHGGYASEARSFMLGLARLPGAAAYFDLRISQHGDAFEHSAWQSLPQKDQVELLQMAHAASRPLLGKAVIVCHSEPGAWALPQPLFQTSLCPPPGIDAYTIGRTMFECDRLSTEHVRRLNTMDEVWVPTQWQRQTFADSGVDATRMVVVPEPVDVAFFNPEGLAALPLPMGELVFGEETTLAHEEQPFRALSIFKWEQRKAWTVLLAAFLSEFDSSDNVELYILTKPYHASSDFKERVQAWAEEQHFTGTLPRVYVITDHIPQAHLPQLYKATDTFVLPSRGEGWGRPHVEAMSMGLPIIATDWSGPTAFLDASVGYPLEIEGLEEVTEAGTFKGCKWATPSVRHLRYLLRHVRDHPEEAAKKGALARKRMVNMYAPEVVARLVQFEVQRIGNLSAMSRRASLM